MTVHAIEWWSHQPCTIVCYSEGAAAPDAPVMMHLIGPNGDGDTIALTHADLDKLLEDLTRQHDERWGKDGA